MRRPVSLLKASKKEHFMNELGTTEMLEESYLWDQDQSKVQNLRALGSIKVMNRGPAQQGKIISRL